MCNTAKEQSARLRKLHGPGASASGGRAGPAFRPLVRKLAGWISVAIAALLFVPAVASAAFILTGKTGQGLPVALRLPSNLSTVTRFAIGWRATCTSGMSLSSATLVGKPIVIQPFPNFHRSANYVFSAISNGQTFQVHASVQLHGALALGGRASGRWAAQAQVVDASGNQRDFCRTGVVRWKARL